MRVELIAFTARGYELALRLAHGLGDAGEEARAAKGFGPDRVPLGSWTAGAFRAADALVYVGATGIAVRAIAPHAASKASDPAVVVLDEGGRWSIPVLSGHLGGANDLARRLAAMCGARAVVTTATDGRGVWAADDWARRHGMAVRGAGAIKAVSGALLAHEPVALASAVPITGALPAGLRRVPAPEPGACPDAGGLPCCLISPFAHDARAARDGAGASETAPAPSRVLQLVPRCVVAGIGCRRGVGAEAIAQAVDEALAAARVLPEALAALASIDIKRDEPGLRAYAARAGLPVSFHAAEELAGVAGSVSPSAFVKRTVGVDNVCERSALSAGGTLIAPKRARDGVTVALALAPVAYDLND